MAQSLIDVGRSMFDVRFFIHSLLSKYLSGKNQSFSRARQSLDWPNAQNSLIFMIAFGYYRLQYHQVGSVIGWDRIPQTQRRPSHLI